MKKRWLIAVGLGAVVVLLFVWRSNRPGPAVRVVTATVQTIHAYVEQQAVTELPHDHLISMPIDGWLEPILLREGDAVTKGQIVARLQTDDLEDRVVQAEQRIAVLETQIDETSDHRLEQNALVETKATVKAIDEMVKAGEAKLDATRAVDGPGPKRAGQAQRRVAGRRHARSRTARSGDGDSPQPRRVSE